MILIMTSDGLIITSYSSDEEPRAKQPRGMSEDFSAENVSAVMIDDDSTDPARAPKFPTQVELWTLNHFDFTAPRVQCSSSCGLVGTVGATHQRPSVDNDGDSIDARNAISTSSDDVTYNDDSNNQSLNDDVPRSVLLHQSEEVLTFQRSLSFRSRDSLKMSRENRWPGSPLGF